MASPRPKSGPVTVLHIEDDPMWTGVTADLLNGWPEFSHVGSAPSGGEGIALCREKQPAIVLLDLGLPDMDGLVVLDKIGSQPFPPRVLLLTGRLDDTLLHRLGSGGGGAGLLRKGADFPRQLRPALAAVADGKPPLPPDVSKAIQRLRASPDAFFKILSLLEQDLLARTAGGCSDEQIARCTGRCASTIRVHFHHIMTKLRLQNRHELRRWAQGKGLLTGCDPRHCAARGE